MVIQLRNCTTLTATNGDELDHTTIGDVMPGAGPAQVAFSGTMAFVGGLGRFSAASGSAEFSGTASLATTPERSRLRGRSCIERDNRRGSHHAMRLPLFQVAVGVCLAIGGVTAQSPMPATYWPGVEWRRATPESQGLDSQALASAIAQVREKQWGIHSLLVVRHGFVVADADFYPYRSTVPHDVASVTKTITSTLTGVAVANRVLRLDQPVLWFFPKESPADADERKRAITVENLLRMESGLDCGFLPGEQELERMKRSANWVAFALALPMKYDRGTRPSYCSPGYHLLGSVIGAAAKTSELEFGRKSLFNPLDIKDVVWGDDPQGRSHGWGDSHFYPRDIAKLGYLYLHGGEWKGNQIVPRGWVAMSIECR